MQAFSSSSTSGSSPPTAEWNQESTTLTAKPRFLRLSICGVNRTDKPADVTTYGNRGEFSCSHPVFGRIRPPSDRDKAHAPRGCVPSKACLHTSITRQVKRIEFQ